MPTAIPDPELTGPDATAPAAEPESASTSWRRSGRRPTRKAASSSSPKTRPSHYKVICISIYTKDLEQLDAKVAELKARGKTKMSKSELIRLALANLNVDEVA